jgi:hypothetical protein
VGTDEEASPVTARAPLTTVSGGNSGDASLGVTRAASQERPGHRQRAERRTTDVSALRMQSMNGAASTLRVSGRLAIGANVGRVWLASQNATHLWPLYELKTPPESGEEFNVSLAVPPMFRNGELVLLSVDEEAHQQFAEVAAKNDDNAQWLDRRAGNWRVIARGTFP